MVEGSNSATAAPNTPGEMLEKRTVLDVFFVVSEMCGDVTISWSALSLGPTAADGGGCNRGDGGDGNGGGSSHL